MTNVLPTEEFGVFLFFFLFFLVLLSKGLKKVLQPQFVATVCKALEKQAQCPRGTVEVQNGPVPEHLGTASSNIGSDDWY